VEFRRLEGREAGQATGGQLVQQISVRPLLRQLHVVKKGSSAIKVLVTDKPTILPQFTQARAGGWPFHPAVEFPDQNGSERVWAGLGPAKRSAQPGDFLRFPKPP
jgi:hypothetical protein